MVSIAGLAGGNTINIVINAVDNFTNTMNKVKGDIKKDFSSKSGVFGQMAVQAGIAAIAVGGIAVAMTSLVKSYTDFEPVQRNFNKLMGEDAQSSLEMFRKASSGLIDDFALMRNANLLFMNIATATPDQFSKMTKAAVLLGRAVGIDATAAFERLTLGIAKGETELLDELGLKLDAQVANKLYAESIGKTVSELTAAERATAALNFILPTLEERIGRLDGLQEGAATSMERLNVQWQNSKRTIGEFLAPQLDVGAQALTGFLTASDSAIEGNVGFVKSMTNVVGNLLIFGGQVKLIFQGVQLAVGEFINEIINNWQSFLNTMVSGINIVISGLNKLGSNIELVGEVDLSSSLVDTEKLLNNMLETNTAIEELRKQSLGLIETGNLIDSGPISPGSTAGGFNTAPGASSTSISKIESMYKDNIEQIRILAEIGGKQEEINKLLQENSILSDKIETARLADKQGAGVTVQIENVYGTDATDIANALQDTLSNQVR